MADLKFPFVEDLGAIVIDLRTRVEALEAKQKASPKKEIGSGWLVAKIMSICAAASDDDPDVWHSEAVFIIREIAEWLENWTYDDAARLLEQEANRPPTSEGV
jgi:hypothetical protein